MFIVKNGNGTIICLIQSSFLKPIFASKEKVKTLIECTFSFISTSLLDHACIFSLSSLQELVPVPQ